MKPTDRARHCDPDRSPHVSESLWVHQTGHIAEMSIVKEVFPTRRLRAYKLRTVFRESYGSSLFHTHQEARLEEPSRFARPNVSPIANRAASHRQAQFCDRRVSRGHVYQSRSGPNVTEGPLAARPGVSRASNVEEVQRVARRVYDRTAVFSTLLGERMATNGNEVLLRGPFRESLWLDVFQEARLEEPPRFARPTPPLSR